MERIGVGIAGNRGDRRGNAASPARLGEESSGEGVLFARHVFGSLRHLAQHPARGVRVSREERRDGVRACDWNPKHSATSARAR